MRTIKHHFLIREFMSVTPSLKCCSDSMNNKKKNVLFQRCWHFNKMYLCHRSVRRMWMFEYRLGYLVLRLSVFPGNLTLHSAALVNYRQADIEVHFPWETITVGGGIYILILHENQKGKFISDWHNNKIIDMGQIYISVKKSNMGIFCTNVQEDISGLLWKYKKWTPIQIYLIFTRLKNASMSPVCTRIEKK